MGAPGVLSTPRPLAPKHGHSRQMSAGGKRGSLSKTEQPEGWVLKGYCWDSLWPRKRPVQGQSSNLSSLQQSPINVIFLHGAMLVVTHIAKVLLEEYVACIPFCPWTRPSPNSGHSRPSPQSLAPASPPIRVCCLTHPLARVCPHCGPRSLSSPDSVLPGVFTSASGFTVIIQMPLPNLGVLAVPSPAPAPLSRPLPGGWAEGQGRCSTSHSPQDSPQ